MAPTSPRRLGIMGGSFDPIHIGHLVCAEEALWQFGLDSVVWVPAGTPWQKKEVSSAEDRFRMVVLATMDRQPFSVSRMEIDRRGPTYTLDTLREFHRFYGPESELFFITGADAVMQILSWKDPEALLAEASFIAANRPPYELTPTGIERFGDRVTIMDIPGLEVSSTDIRRRLAEGAPVRYLVPPAVADYIADRGLYGSLERQSA